MSKTRSIILRIIITNILLTTTTLNFAQSFIDDFSSDSVSQPNFRIFTDNLANPNTVATFNGSELEVSIEHNDPTNLAERAVFEIQSPDRPDLITSTGMFTGDRPSTGTFRYEMEGNFFNRIQNGGPNPENREGDVEVDLVIGLAANPADDFANYCIKERDSADNSSPLNGVQENCSSFNTTVALNTPYTFTAGIDRNTNQIIAQLNDERIVVDYEGMFFEPQRENTVYTRFRVRDGADSGSFSYSSVIFNNGGEVDLNAIANPSPFKQDDFDFYDDDPSRSKEIINNRLKLSATNSDPESDNTSQLRFRTNGTFIGGDITYSSESIENPTGEGFQSIRLSGLLYNDLSDDVNADLTGSVFAAVSLIENGSSELVGEYCLIRSNDASFNTSTDLADGMDDGRCPTFDILIEADTSYSASVDLDIESRTVTFTLGGEQKTVNITSDIFLRESDTLRAQARIAFGATGTIVGFVDNLTNSSNLIVLEQTLIVLEQKVASLVTLMEASREVAAGAALVAPDLHQDLCTSWPFFLCYFYYDANSLS